MAPTPYAPPDAPVRDLLPEGPGPIADWLAVIIGLATGMFLTMFVADMLSTLFAMAIGADFEGETAWSFLIVDLVLTYAGELFAFWMTLRLCRSRSFRVVTILAALSWAILLGDRWVLNNYGWPLWYEIALLCAAPLALLSLYALQRRRDAFA